MTTPVSATTSPRRARRKRAAKSSASPEGRSLPASSTGGVSTEAAVVMLAMCPLMRLHGSWIGLHYKIAWGARNAVFVRTVVDHGNVAAEIVVGRRSGGSPLERRRLPGIVGGFFTELHAPEKIEEKNQLPGDGNEGRVGHELLQGDQVVQVAQLGELGVA